MRSWLVLAVLALCASSAAADVVHLKGGGKLVGRVVEDGDTIRVVMAGGTLSLSKELKSVPVSAMQIGDVFIQGGSPGHAIIVVDMAMDKAGQKLFLLAQSYMPAQELQILKNPRGEDEGPWYSADFGQWLKTPEWTFGAGDLKRF